MGMMLIYIHIAVQNMVILNPYAINYKMSSYFLYLFKKLHKQAADFSSRVE